MSLHVTPDMLEAAYELLRTTPPFRRWKLPHADEVEFRVVTNPAIHGSFRFAAQGKPVLTISSANIGRLSTLIEAVAHELVHAEEDMHRGGRPDVSHSRVWRSLAAQVCRHHGFDEKLF